MNQMNDIFNNKTENFYYMKGNELEDKLFVVFSSRDLKNSNNFSFFKTFRKLNINTIFIKSSKNTWYHSGITNNNEENISDVFIEIIEQILTHCKHKKIQTIHVIGASMGGYAALLFAHFINTLFIENNIYVEIISLCPETVLFLQNSRSLNNNESFKNIVPTKYVDITLLKYYANKITIYFGEYDLVDVYSALKFKFFNQNRNLKIFSIIDGNHLIAEQLNERYRNGIYEFFYNMFFFNIYEPILSGNIAKCLNYKDIEPFIYDKDTFNNFEKLTECIMKYPSFGLMYNRLGLLNEKNENIPLAKFYFNLSLLLNPNHQNSKNHLNYISSIKGKYSC